MSNVLVCPVHGKANYDISHCCGVCGRHMHVEGESDAQRVKRLEVEVEALQAKLDAKQEENALLRDEINDMLTEARNV